MLGFFPVKNKYTYYGSLQFFFLLDKPYEHNFIYLFI